MDITRSQLDELMGKDRDITNEERAKKKENYDDPEVCKYYLVSRCPHDLFPNTKQDLGMCHKRHDNHFKRQFEQDQNRLPNEKRYLNDILNLIEGLLNGIDSRIKKAKIKLENAVDDRIEQLPLDIQKKVESIDEEIKKYLAECQKLGTEGKLEDAVTIMEEVDKLKKRKEDILRISENPNSLNSKNMKVCDICGAMQTVIDTDKRVQTHLEGKLHTGFAILRKEFDILKERREEIKKGIASMIIQKKDERKSSRARSKDKKKSKKKDKRSESSSDRQKKKHHHRSRRSRDRDDRSHSRSEKKEKKSKKHRNKDKENDRKSYRLDDSKYKDNYQKSDTIKNNETKQQ